jgi:dipeptidyl aminopeptidase/acylaminoacyl peptidase
MTVQGGIFVVDVATGVQTRLTTNTRPPAPGIRTDDSDPRFSPDGTQIVFTRGRNQQEFELWLMGSDGEISGPAATPLAVAGMSDWQPTWSVDGSRIFFTSDRVGGVAAIYTVDPAVGEASVTRISGPEATSWGHPAISPDGRTLATYSTATLVLQDIATDVHFVPLFDPRFVNFSGVVGAQNIEFSPDGSQLVFVADNNIYITVPQHIVTPVERAAELVTAIQSLIDDGLVGGSEGAVLQGKLGNVTALVESGSLKAAANNVNATLNHVRALVNSRRINVITAQLLTINANALLDAINNM